MNSKKITRFAFILVLITLVTGLFSCNRAQQVVKPVTPQTETSTPIEERDHVWVVDQNGVDVPVPGTWVLVSHTHLNSTSTIGESFTLPPDSATQCFNIGWNIHGWRGYPLDKGENNI